MNEILEIERCLNCHQLKQVHIPAGLHMRLWCKSEAEIRKWCEDNYTRSTNVMTKDQWGREFKSLRYQEMTPLELSIWIEEQHERRPANV